VPALARPVGSPWPVSPLARRRLVDDATQALRDAILAGRFPAGARLRQTDLADQLGISRTPIREALGRLEYEGLVRLMPRGGVSVAVLDLEAAAALYDVREVLDGLAARLAAQRASKADLARLDQALAAMAQCLERGDANQWFAAHVQFHDAIFAASGNPRLVGLSTVVRQSIQHFHPLLLRTDRRLEAALAEHRAIHAAIAGRAAEEAERRAREHIVNAKAIVLRMLAEGARDGAVQA
jgi:DNA-binding GntR family transcriptional regulator